ncbi:hypothetical protein AAFC00_007261 [Neodothiora populina]|uniref:Telomere length regulation protein conserved domain-containing protein n=1 Tax=Neodothiora populina TaxID=2781224 RepID=A0ABR3PHP6_9PEZI
MTDFLTEVKTVTLRPKPNTGSANELRLKEHKVTKPLIQSEPPVIKSPEDVLDILRSQPDIDTLEDVLIYLSQRQGKDGFDIRLPSPASARIVHEIVNTTIPDFWENLGGLRDLLLQVLRSIAGISATLARLQLLVSECKTNKQSPKSSNATSPIRDLIAVLGHICNTDDLTFQILSNVRKLAQNQTRSDLLWKEYLATIATGRIVSSVAEAETVLDLSTAADERSWLSDGSRYSAWLGRNVAHMVRQSSSLPEDPNVKAAAQLYGKACNIGYAARVVEEIRSRLIMSDDCPIDSVQKLINNMQIHEQRQFLLLTLRYLTKQHVELTQTASVELEGPSGTPEAVAAYVSLLHTLLCNEIMKSHLKTWLSDPTANATESFVVRRAAISALDRSKPSNLSLLDEDPMQSTLESVWQMFGDSFFIRHTPVVQQEACSQTLLLLAGYVYRAQPMFLFTLARSSVHLNGISNRLNASSQRARFLGMVVGTAISELVAKSGAPLSFDVEDMKTPEAQWYLELTKVNDEPCSVDEMRQSLRKKSIASKPKVAYANAKSEKTKQVKKAATSTVITGPRIMEIFDDEEEEDEDLKPYAKPDSDPEDEDEDATLVNRNKQKAPVYIRDLISRLRDSENHERHTLALKSAASLIRRKSSFGKEVSDHAVELALILVGLGNPFDIEDFAELRLQALIATLLSDPTKIAPWLCRQVFDGDYSLSQRATILSTLGLGARELAGYKDEDEALNPTASVTSFPSKRLPERLHKIYAGKTDRTALIASNLERSLMQPMAAKAADNMTGPNILKVRTFSSRMEVEKKRKKPITNALAKIVAESFFFPLTGGWWQNVNAYGGGGGGGKGQNIHFQPFLLTTYIKTLAILLHASGPNTLSLPQMTTEFWGLLLDLRTTALNDTAVLEAVLFAFLTLLQVNEEQSRRLAEEQGKELMETQGWVELVFERFSSANAVSFGSAGAGGGPPSSSAGREGAPADGEAERVRMLSAGILVKTRDIVERFQRLLVGDMLDY